MKNSLFNDFKPVSSKAWKQQIQFELEGDNYNNLTSITNEGIVIKPFYQASDIVTSETATVGKNYDTCKTCEFIHVIEAKKANVDAINALKQGIESLAFIIPNKTVSIDVLLDKIDKSTILFFEIKFLSTSYILELKKKHPQAIISSDVINNLAKTGNWHRNLNTDLDSFKKHSKLTKSISIDISLYQNAGANIVQQLAYGLAHANEYLNILDNIDSKQEYKFTFKTSTGSHYFFEIAKLKALRLLWSSLAEAYCFNKACLIITTPSKRNKTLYKPKANITRTTTECMSAMLGGANYVCNSTYDSLHKQNNNVSANYAKHQLLHLQTISAIKNIENPTDGSYYIESITQQLADKALALFKDIERHGGFLNQLKLGTIQRKIKENENKEAFQFKNKTLTLVGANLFVDTRNIKSDIEIYPFRKQHSRKTLLEPIIEKRLAESIEKNRLNQE